jgi:hypothetical protein
MPLQATSGAASYDAFGGGVPVVPNYIEEVFSTWLYTGNGATGQPIVNGINLSTKGGLVWLKSRTTPSGSSDNNLYDTVRGASQLLISNSTNAQTTATRLSFQTTGFNLTNEASSTNESGVSYVSWTFREQPKFFDVVTYTGNGSTQTISHNLGSVPGCIIVKRLNNASNTGWPVYHRYDYQQHGFLNLTNGFTGAQEETWFGNNVISVAPTSTVFTVGSNQDINANTNTYVAYIFAHNAGGFGLTGTDNVISCGSYTGNGSTTGPEINLGYEPQWLLIKNTTTSGYDWWMFDVMRGWTNTSSGDNTSRLTPDSSQAEDLDRVAIPTSTGFRLVSSTTNYNGSGDNYIYIAIRRGPMKVPTSGTSVFSPINVNNSTGTQNTTNFPVDLQIARNKANGEDTFFYDRLRGVNTTNVTDASPFLTSVSTAAEASALNRTRQWGSTGYFTPANFNNVNAIYWNFRRAPSFFDEVCYTGTGSARTVNHNLAAVPELMIVKRRSAIASWSVYTATTGNNVAWTLNSTSSITGNDEWNTTTPTSTVFSLGTAGNTNASSATYVAYLFATCSGVSKVSSYTGTGATQTISCGFTGGARFVLIKRTDTDGYNWYVWDTARGMVSGTDPSLLLNDTAAEVNANSIYTTTGGFQIVSTAAGINANGGTFIFLAIA